LKLAVFDFDCTLTKFHVFALLAGCATSSDKLKREVPPPYARSEKGQMSRLRALDANWGPGAFALEALGGPIRVVQLQSLLKELRNHKVECMILSGGMETTIRLCLKQVGLLSQFSDVVGNTGCSMGTTDYHCSLQSPSDVRWLAGWLAGWLVVG
jgi:phosphoserine phosphatase